MKPCLSTLVYELITLSIAWPIYLYYSIKWYEYRNHFVILNRYPKISIIVFGGIIVLQIMSLTESILCIDSISTFNIAFSNIINGLVFYRTYLFYVQYIESQSYLALMAYQQNERINNITFRYTPTTHLGHKICANGILVSASISCIFVIIFRFWHNTIIVMSALTVTNIIGIVVVITLLIAKVKDSIGCVKESLLIISVNIVLLILGPFLAKYLPDSIQTHKIIGHLGITIIAFFVLFIGLQLIKQKEDKTLELLRSKSLDVDAIGCSSADSDTEPNISANDTHDINKPLHEYLEDSKRYILFAGYLSECFALESLLFLERTIILFHVILKYKSLDTGFVAATHDTHDNHDNHDQYNTGYYNLTFDYLSQIYADINEMIEEMKEIDTNNSNQMLYKKGILAVIKSIYSQFCRQDCPNQINVCSEVQKKLQQLFENVNADVIDGKFNNYDELIHVFQEAMDETWQLCHSVYNFQFKVYIQKMQK